jgi:hypothetical protein
MDLAPRHGSDGEGGGIMSYVYIRSEPGLWTVGFYAPDGKWHTDSDHDDREEAASRVHYLNGGQS